MPHLLLQTTQPALVPDNAYALVWAVLGLALGGGGKHVWDYLNARRKGETALRSQDNRNAWALAMQLQAQVQQLSHDLGTVQAELAAVQSERAALMAENDRQREKITRLEAEVKRLQGIVGGSGVVST